jgi:hypothetical protein
VNNKKQLYFKSINRWHDQCCEKTSIYQNLLIWTTEKKTKNNLHSCNYSFNCLYSYTYTQIDLLWTMVKEKFFFLYKISLMNFRDRHLKEKIKYQILSLYYKLWLTQHNGIHTTFFFVSFLISKFIIGFIFALLKK